jgi:hypothetical protein
MAKPSSFPFAPLNNAPDRLVVASKCALSNLFFFFFFFFFFL